MRWWQLFDEEEVERGFAQPGSIPYGSSCSGKIFSLCQTMYRSRR
jgi:hypothetical protein